MRSERGQTGNSGVEPLSPEVTIHLLMLARSGDRAALERLLERCLPPLRRFAHGRLPYPRGMNDTADVVQDVVIAAIGRIDSFEARYQGSLLDYLRRAVRNRITDIIKMQNRRPENVELPESLKDGGQSPVEILIGAENVARYDAALERLSPSDREAIVGRLEMQYSYEELATVLDKPTPDAARMAVTRAMKRLVEELRHDC